MRAVLTIASVLTAVCASAAARAPSVRPQFTQTSLNVFRRFAVEDRARMIDFYGKALVLKPLQPIQVNADLQMILFRVGSSGQIKLASGLVPGRHYHVGGVTEATGIRLFALHYPDAAAVAARFAAAGSPAPLFKLIGGGRRAAFVRDPAGFDLELVINRGAAPETSEGVEVGIARRRTGV